MLHTRFDESSLDELIWQKSECARCAPGVDCSVCPILQCKENEQSVHERIEQENTKAPTGELSNY